MKRSTYLALGLGLVLIVGVACGGGDGEEKEATEGTASPAAGTDAAIDFVSASGIQGGDPEFNYSVLTWQGYWLSRDHFGPFVMASGMGIPFEPPMDAVQQAIQMVAQNPNDPAMVPQNMAPLQAVFASGSPTLINDPSTLPPLDFQAFRLDPASFDQRVTVRGQAETMLKESQWAHNFADPHFGDPQGDFGAQQRFIGMMVAMLAQMQGQYAMQNLVGDDGLYHDSDDTLDETGNWVMLHALADISGLTGERGDLNHGRYMNQDSHSMFDGAATQLFRALEQREPESAREGAAAVRALVYLAWTTGDSSVRDAALAKAVSIADDILVNFSSSDAVENAAAVAGLIAVDAAQRGGRFRDAADALFQRLAGDFDAGHGVFESRDVYNVDDVAWIVGGLNALAQQGNDASKGPAARMLLAFYESTISLAGMQLSAPPGKDGAMAGEFEKDLPSVVYYHPADTPPPPVAGKLPVPAEEITWDGSAWSVTSERFVPAGAMHLANELNWIGPHLGSIPFPPLAEQSGTQPEASATAGGTTADEFTVVGEDISFDETSLSAAAGEQITITFENRDQGVPHNFHVFGPGGQDEKTAIEEGPLTQTLTLTIEEPGSYAFVCDVHPGRMTGELVVH